MKAFAFKVPFIIPAITALNVDDYRVLFDTVIIDICPADTLLQDVSLSFDETHNILSAVNHQGGALDFLYSPSDNVLAPIRPNFCQESLSDSMCHMLAICPVNPSKALMSEKSIQDVNEWRRNWKPSKGTYYATLANKLHANLAKSESAVHNNVNLMSSNTAAESITWDDAHEFLKEQFKALDDEFPSDDDFAAVKNNNKIEQMEQQRRLHASILSNIDEKVNSFLSNLLTVKKKDPSDENIKKMIAATDALIAAGLKHKKSLTSQETSDLAEGLPLHFDPREKDRGGGLSSMKKCFQPEAVLDQKSCGSCWAYSAATEMTIAACSKLGGDFFNRDGVMHTFSPKQILDCWSDPKLSIKESLCESGGYIDSFNEAHPDLILFAHLTDPRRCGDGYFESKEYKEPKDNAMCQTSSMAPPSDRPCRCEVSPTFLPGTTYHEQCFDVPRNKRRGKATKIHSLEGVDNDINSLIGRALIYTRGAVRMRIRAPSIFSNTIRNDPAYSTREKVYQVPLSVTDDSLKHGEHSNHAVVAVGWGHDNIGMYWIIQNSWGRTSTDGGFYKAYANDKLFTTLYFGTMIVVTDLELSVPSPKDLSTGIPKLYQPNDNIGLNTEHTFIHGLDPKQSDPHYGLSIGLDCEKYKCNGLILYSQINIDQPYKDYSYLKAANAFTLKIKPNNQYSTLPSSYPVLFMDSHNLRVKKWVHTPPMIAKELDTLAEALQKYWASVYPDLTKRWDHSSVYKGAHFDRSLFCRDNIKKEFDPDVRPGSYESSSRKIATKLCKMLDDIDKKQDENALPDIEPEDEPEPIPEPEIDPIPIPEPVSENGFELESITIKPNLFYNTDRKLWKAVLILECKIRNKKTNELLIDLCNVAPTATGSVSLTYEKYDSRYHGDFEETVHTWLNSLGEETKKRMINAMIIVPVFGSPISDNISVVMPSEPGITSKQNSAISLPNKWDIYNLLKEYSEAVEQPKYDIVRKSEVLMVSDLCELNTNGETPTINELCSYFNIKRNPNKGKDKLKPSIIKIGPVGFNHDGKLYISFECNDSLPCAFKSISNHPAVRLPSLEEVTFVPAEWKSKVLVFEGPISLDTTLVAGIKYDDESGKSNIVDISFTIPSTVSTDYYSKVVPEGMIEEKIFTFSMKNLCESPYFGMMKNLKTLSIINRYFTKICSRNTFYPYPYGDDTKPLSDRKNPFTPHIPDVIPSNPSVFNMVQLNNFIDLVDGRHILSVDCNSISSDGKCEILKCTYDTITSLPYSSNSCVVMKNPIFFEPLYQTGIFNHQVYLTLYIAFTDANGLKISQKFMISDSEVLLLRLRFPYGTQSVNMGEVCDKVRLGESHSLQNLVSISSCEQLGWGQRYQSSVSIPIYSEQTPSILFNIQGNSLTYIPWVRMKDGSLLFFIPFSLRLQGGIFPDVWFFDHFTTGPLFHSASYMNSKKQIPNVLMFDTYSPKSDRYHWDSLSHVLALNVTQLSAKSIKAQSVRSIVKEQSGRYTKRSITLSVSHSFEKGSEALNQLESGLRSSRVYSSTVDLYKHQLDIPHIEDFGIYTFLLRRDCTSLDALPDLICNLWKFKIDV